MGCKSCKDKDKLDALSVFKNKNKKNTETITSSSDIGFQLFNISVRLFMFAVGLCLTPFIMLFVVYLLFKIIVLNDGDVNLMPTLLKIANTIGIGKKKKIEEEFPDDYEDLDSDNPDDYEFDEKVDKIEL